VFYVHNRVSSIQRTASQIAELVPEARVAVAHGQMSETLLEQVMVDFWERKFDVLVATTIIETGLDIANANTLIIDRADKYGLSQLHQLRGRVGRGRERAYAYFLYDEMKPLSETAHERLNTIAANNELGAGMQIALKDLEIRGAGNLLGGEQSGHIAGVGFDLYAANYLSVGQIYLFDNPLLREPLERKHVKPRPARPLGHDAGAELHLCPSQPGHQTGTRPRCPLHLRPRPRRAGHGGEYLSRRHLFRNLSRTSAGRGGAAGKLFRQFSFPGGIPSHAAPRRRAPSTRAANSAMPWCMPTGRPSTIRT
jgi:hypothetical protein